MSKSIYNYTKDVLKKVSFNPILFKKELFKTSKVLLPCESNGLIIWVKKFILNKPGLEAVLI